MPIGSDKGSFIKPGFLPLTVGPEGPTAAQAWAWGLNNLGSLGLGDYHSTLLPSTDRH